MERWRFIDLGRPRPLIAQTFYEAIAEAVHGGISPNTLVMLQPGRPYVCLGYHQDLETEIDLAFCKEMRLPIIRRSQGGGATYLDGEQVFYQIIAKDSPVVSINVEEMFKKLLSVTVETYRRLGVEAKFKPLNDVIVEGRKISGNGAGVHESTSILVGNIILDLDYEMMAGVLKVPDEKFRDKMAKSMRDWVTSLKRELGHLPSPEHVKQEYIAAFQEFLGVELVRQEPNEREYRIFHEEVEPRHMSNDWLYMEAPLAGLREGRAVKIAGDVKFIEADHKAKKLIRVRAEVKEKEILSIQIRGDYFAIPKESISKLEKTLRGIELDEHLVSKTIRRFYHDSEVQTPGIEPQDFVTAVMKIKSLI